MYIGLELKGYPVTPSKNVVLMPGTERLQLLSYAIATTRSEFIAV